MLSDRLLFDTELAEEAKLRGMSIAALYGRKMLEIARAACVEAALSRPERTATADDAQRFLIEAGYGPLGNAAGSLFHTSDWEFTGQWTKSTRVSNHKGDLRIWRLNW